MAATLPVGVAVRLAGVAVPQGVSLTGTVWQGTARLADHQASWDSRGWASVAARALVADLRVTGPQTDLAGRAALRPGAVTLAPLQGRMGWPLLATVLPGLEIACTTTAQVDVVRLGVAVQAHPAQAPAFPALDATGQVRLAAGRCARVDGTVTDVPLPALLADIATTADGVGIAVTGLDAPDVPLGNLLVTPDARLRITVHPAGAAMVPGLPTGGDSQIELPLGLFAP